MAQLTSIKDMQGLGEEIDYQKQFQKEKAARIYFQTRVKELELKIKKYINDNHNPQIQKNRQRDALEVLDQIKSYKCTLPTSVRQIPEYIFHPDQNKQMHNQFKIEKIFHEFAVYGVSEDNILQAKENQMFQGEFIFSSEHPSQTLQHTAKLVFPSGIKINKFYDRDALQKGIEIMNLPIQTFKSFILTFQPTEFKSKIPTSLKGNQEEIIINILNPQRRVYAVCMEFEEFSFFDKNSENIFAQRLNTSSKKEVKFALNQCAFKSTGISTSKRVICLLTYYPFFNFLEQILKGLLNLTKMQRYMKFKQNGQKFQEVDSSFNQILLKKTLQKAYRQSKQKSILMNKLIDIHLGHNFKLYLNLNELSCKQYFSAEWAYPILSLFTLDVFLDLLTLIMLQEKIVFICENLSILTYAVFLFTKVLLRPFQYPFPVVNVIPDQEQYLNAPFPIVYGYCKSKEQILSNKINKKYKNVYVFFTPQNVEICYSECKKKLLAKKPIKLRDKLMAKFKKMSKNYPQTQLSIFEKISPKKIDLSFSFKVDQELSRQIIMEVHSYLVNEILQHLPSEEEVESIRRQVKMSKEMEKQDVNQQTYLRIKEKYKNKRKDPFYMAFLETQLFNVYIFKY